MKFTSHTVHGFHFESMFIEYNYYADYVTALLTCWKCGLSSEAISYARSNATGEKIAIHNCSCCWTELNCTKNATAPVADTDPPAPHKNATACNKAAIVTIDTDSGRVCIHLIG